MGRKDTPNHSSITLPALQHTVWNAQVGFNTQDTRQVQEPGPWIEKAAFARWIFRAELGLENKFPISPLVSGHPTPHPVAHSHWALIDICIQLLWEMQIFPYPVTKLLSHCSKCHWLQHARWAWRDTTQGLSQPDLLPSCPNAAPTDRQQDSPFSGI